ncbi:MAG: flagellar biosynthetic protein FliO [Treponema sp.]|nr:flagellar biosynthetic protein FliO [Treponema sp.]
MGGEELKLSLFTLLLIAAGFLVQIQYVSAQEESSAQEEPPVPAEQSFPFGGTDESPALSAGSSVWPIIRMILVLALAAVAVYGVVIFLKRSSKQTFSKDPFLKILATTHLGANRYAHIVSVGSKAWLLGSSDGGVNLIGEVNDKDVIDAMLLEDSRKSNEPKQGLFPDFVSMLRKLGLPAQTGVPGTEDIRKRSERLRGL